jgi:hypothetical protein
MNAQFATNIPSFLFFLFTAFDVLGHHTPLQDLRTGRSNSETHPLSE